jgi:hypothetical protein
MASIENLQPLFPPLLQSRDSNGVVLKSRLALKPASGYVSSVVAGARFASYGERVYPLPLNNRPSNLGFYPTKSPQLLNCSPALSSRAAPHTDNKFYPPMADKSRIVLTSLSGIP